MRLQVPVLLIVFATAGCAGTPPPPPVYLNRDVHRVVVLPPFNETITNDAWKTAWPHVLEGVRACGYDVVPRSDVEAFYVKNNFHATPEEILLYTTAELAKEFGAQAVLYSNIEEWGFKYIGVYSEYVVAVEFRLADGKTGDALWQDKSRVAKRESVGGRNPFELALSLIGVAGNAFARSSDHWAEVCILEGLRRMPHAGFAPVPPGTNPPPAPSEDK